MCTTGEDMRSFLICLAVCGLVTVGYSFPNTQQQQRRQSQETDLDRLLEIAEEISKTAKTEVSDRRRGNDDDSEEDDDGGVPYIEREIEYLKLARRVADQYMEEERRNREETSGSSTTNDALRAFNRPSRRTRMLDEQSQRENAERLALQLLTGTSKNQRNLADIDLSAFSAVQDPTCNKNVDCSKKENSNFVDNKEFRTIDGSCNNKQHFSWGIAGAQHRRLIPNAYDDGKFEFRTKSESGGNLPSAREISNKMHKTATPKGENTNDISIALFYFMQFIDHDLAKTPEGHVRGRKECCKKPNKFKKYCMPITFDAPGEDFFSPGYCIEGRRSFTVFECNSAVQNQINELTSYLDGSMVYGSSREEEHTLRTFIAGLMEQSTNEFLPNSSRAASLPCNLTNNEHRKDSCFEAGDTRANVHPGLLTFHTLFVREHNRIAKKFRTIFEDWSDERIYQETRKIIGAMIQHIVYTEMLPVLITDEVLKERGVSKQYSYDPNIDASMTQAFAICYRYHNIMPHKLNLARQFGSSAKVFNQENQEFAIQTPFHVTNNNYEGIDEVSLGMVVSKCPHVDRLMNSAARNLLFLDKDGNSTDLATLNILRGRDWGTPGYTLFRAECGLGKATTWHDLKGTTSEANILKLASVYKDVRDVDLWTGMISEDPLPGSISGPTQSCIVAKHFSNLKHGDRFWYENKDFGFSEQQLREIKKTTIARILCSNLDVQMMPESAFLTNSSWKRCSSLVTNRDIFLKQWPK